jgi:hypothetical protein
LLAGQLQDMRLGCRRVAADVCNLFPGRDGKGVLVRLISTRVHGVIDYVVGLALIAVPLAVGINPAHRAAEWVPIILGIGAIGYSMLTRYEFGFIRVLPMPAHLGMDVVSGLLLAASPWLFRFAADVHWPHVIVGIAEIGIALMTCRTSGLAETTTGELGGGIHRHLESR